MKKYIDADRLKELLDAKYKEFTEKAKEDCPLQYQYMADGLDIAEQFVDSLQQEQPEVELTEFERGIKRGFLCAGLEDVPTGIIKDTAKELIKLVKKELCVGCTKCTDEYLRGRKEAMEEASKSYDYTGPAIPTYFPPCYHGGPCTNPFHDCINCPRQSTIGINTNTGTSTAKVEG